MSARAARAILDDVAGYLRLTTARGATMWTADGVQEINALIAEVEALVAPSPPLCGALALGEHSLRGSCTRTVPCPDHPYEHIQPTADTPVPRQLSDEERALWEKASAVRPTDRITKIDADFIAACSPAVILSLLTALSTEREAGERNAKLVDACRVAMRSIGLTYHLVQGAALRAAKSGNERRSDDLDHVYGRLFWMDHALGTMAERVAAAPSTETPR